MRAYSYRRWSNAIQKTGDSARRQDAMAERWVRENDAELDTSLPMLDPGVSAYTGENLETGKLAAFIAAIQSGRVVPGSVLLIEQLDRFSRADIDIALNFFCQILRAGVNIVTLRNSKMYTKASIGTNDIIMAVLELILAHDESAKKSERLQAAWQRKRDTATETKLTANAHRWLRLSKDRKSFAVIPEKAAVILRIFELTCDGYGVQSVAKKLNREGVKSIGKQPLWHSSYIHKILSDRAVLGEFQRHRKVDRKRVPDGEPLKDYFPRIVPDELWYRAHESMKTRHLGAGRKGRNVANLFGKILFDARDGTPMNALSKGYVAGVVSKVLVSSGAYRGLPGSEYVTLPYEFFEACFLRFAKELKPADVTSGSANGIESRITVLSGRLTEIEAKVAKLKKAIETDPDIDAFISSLATQERQKKSVAKELEELRAKSSSAGETEVLGETQSIIAMLGKATGDDLVSLRTKIKARIAQLAESIWVLVSAKPKVRGRPGTGKFRTALVQVYLRNGQCRQFFLDTQYRFGLSEVVANPPDDLRTWRYGRPELKSPIVVSAESPIVTVL